MSESELFNAVEAWAQQRGLPTTTVRDTTILSCPRCGGQIFVENTKHYFFCYTLTGHPCPVRGEGLAALEAVFQPPVDRTDP